MPNSLYFRELYCLNFEAEADYDVFMVWQNQEEVQQALERQSTQGRVMRVRLLIDATDKEIDELLDHASENHGWLNVLFRIKELATFQRKHIDQMAGSGHATPMSEPIAKGLHVLAEKLGELLEHPDVQPLLQGLTGSAFFSRLP
jgi:hypothetical protein